MSVCVCVCERETEVELAGKRQRKIGIVCERESEKVCVREKEEGNKIERMFV